MATATLALSGCAELKQTYKDMQEPPMPHVKGDFYTFEEQMYACENQSLSGEVLWGRSSDCPAHRRVSFCSKHLPDKYSGFCVNPDKLFPGKY